MVAEVTSCSLSEVTDWDVARWAAYWKVYPPQLQQQTNLLAQVCSLICNVAGNTSVKPIDFLFTTEDYKNEKESLEFELWATKLNAQHKET